MCSVEQGSESFPDWVTAKRPYNQELVISTYKRLIHSMPHANQYLLLYVLDLLSVFARKSDKNLMTAQSMHSLLDRFLGSPSRRLHRSRRDLPPGADVAPRTRALALRAPAQPRRARVPHRPPRLVHARHPPTPHVPPDPLPLLHTALRRRRTHERERRRGPRRLAHHPAPPAHRRRARKTRRRGIQGHAAAAVAVIRCGTVRHRAQPHAPHVAERPFCHGGCVGGFGGWCEAWWCGRGEHGGAPQNAPRERAA
ncbi:hypothetical protein EDB86DRAFT_2194824 [Lactarius hatsudake]|nr:hypothetical protein EDB86DRAFT_2194824 [Lactarius hatsudake]